MHVNLNHPGQSSQYVFVHLRNAFDEDTALLRKMVELTASHNSDVLLITDNAKGHLSNIANAKHQVVNCKIDREKKINYVRMFCLQVQLFAMLFIKTFRKNTTVYYDSSVSLGAGLAGRLLGHRVIFQSVRGLHTKTGSAEKLLSPYAIKYASEVVGIATHQLKPVFARKKQVHDIKPVLSATFRATADAKMGEEQTEVQNFNVLVLFDGRNQSIKDKCVELGDLLHDVDFELVDVNKANCPTVNELHDQYRKANIVVSFFEEEEMNVDHLLRSVGALYYGCPCVAHDSNIMNNIIRNDDNGYIMDCNDLFGLRKLLYGMIRDFDIYTRLSIEAQHTAFGLTEKAYEEGVVRILHLDDARKNIVVEKINAA
jgi:L-malate glycosyltransferase